MSLLVLKLQGKPVSGSPLQDSLKGTAEVCHFPFACLEAILYGSYTNTHCRMKNGGWLGAWSHCPRDDLQTKTHGHWFLACLCAEAPSRHHGPCLIVQGRVQVLLTVSRFYSLGFKALSIGSSNMNMQKLTWQSQGSAKMGARSSAVSRWRMHTQQVIHGE